MYFEKMIENIKTNCTQDNLLKNIITPFAPYYICNHFVGDEVYQRRINIPTDKNDLMKNNNIETVNDFDIIYVEVKYFNYFVNDLLTKINKKIILITGQWLLPKLHQSNQTDELLNNSKILLWFAQNPIYENNSKYHAFPYGISYMHIMEYAKVLLTNNIVKTDTVVNLGLDYKTNQCRLQLPFKRKQPLNIFYNNIKKAKYVISPIGDRDDCYRHYECIGLEAFPMSNVGNLYKNIFGENMYYCSIEEMLVALEKKRVNHNYFIPNKNLICVEFYKNMIFNLLKQVQ